MRSTYKHTSVYFLSQNAKQPHTSLVYCPGNPASGILLIGYNTIVSCDFTIMRHYLFLILYTGNCWLSKEMKNAEEEVAAKKKQPLQDLGEEASPSRCLERQKCLHPHIDLMACHQRGGGTVVNFCIV